ncbi:DDE-type integrase/transposase/recombinase [Lacimicrobium sp. SS2-24]|uniref:DDE-type integrase/transposase/recombinase n=1 Tax=Lacimicrobium sp. SS2-24 TaxID=2005569 RepID=UPI000B4AF41E|nr:DDE-type integrase/transposase/recombinase [Lacimicrobium sp. SS2-24]
MADLTMANLSFSEGQIFYYEEHENHFYIESVANREPTDILYCVPFDTESRTPLSDLPPHRFKASVVTKAMWDGQAEFIDPTAAQAEPISPTSKQQARIDMWVEFMEILKTDNYGRLPRANDAVSKAIQKMNWVKYNYQTPSLSNCQEKIKRYDEAEQQARALCPHGSHAMTGASKVAPATEELMLNYLDDYFLVHKPKHNVNPAEIYRQFSEEFESLHRKHPALYPKLPCMETFYKRIRALDKIVVAMKRLGDNERKKLQRQRKTEFIVDRILQRVEIDAVHVSMGIIKYVDNGRTQKRIYRGRIVLMLAIDVFSRAIIGYSYHIGKKPGENADLSVECFKSVLMPKRGELDWPIFGKPMYVVSDGSTAAAGNQHHEAVTSTGAIHITTQTGQPWKKPFIERLIGTVRKEFFGKLDTYLGSKVFRNHDHLNSDDAVEKVVLQKGKKHCFTEEEFLERLEHYITEIYNKNPHKGLGDNSPLEVWKKSVSKNQSHFVTLPREHSAFTRMGLYLKSRKIYSDGSVRVKNALYSSPKLKSLYGTVSEIDIYYSDVNVRHVSFMHKGKWYSADLCPANYTPTDTDQRSELDYCRDNQHGPKKTSSRRKSYEPEPALHVVKKSSSNGKSDGVTQDKVQNISLDSNTAKADIEALEAERLKNLPPQAKNINPVSVTEDVTKTKTTDTTSRKRNIGKKL